MLVLSTGLVITSSTWNEMPLIASHMRNRLLVRALPGHFRSSPVASRKLQYRKHRGMCILVLALGRSVSSLIVEQAVHCGRLVAYQSLSDLFEGVSLLGLQLRKRYPPAGYGWFCGLICCWLVGRIIGRSNIASFLDQSISSCRFSWLV